MDYQQRVSSSGRKIVGGNPSHTTVSHTASNHVVRKPASNLSGLTDITPVNGRSHPTAGTHSHRTATSHFTTGVAPAPAHGTNQHMHGTKVMHTHGATPVHAHGTTPVHAHVTSPAHTHVASRLYNPLTTGLHEAQTHVTAGSHRIGSTGTYSSGSHQKLYSPSHAKDLTEMKSSGIRVISYDKVERPSFTQERGSSHAPKEESSRVVSKTPHNRVAGNISYPTTTGSTGARIPT